jgi:spermidine synthase
MNSRHSGRRPLEFREDQTPTSGIFFKARRSLYRGRSRFQRIEVFENDAFGRVLFLDGLVQTTEKDEFFYHEMLVHPALLRHPRPRRVLIIGGGDGGALREVLRHPVEKATLVEIDGRVIEVCKEHFGWLRPALRGGRAEIVVDDGNVFLNRTRDRFDVILVDSSDPVGPSTVLHQKAFYERVKRRLSPGGIAAAQAGALLYHLDSHRRKNAFLRTLFRHAHFYIGPVPTYPGGMWCYVFCSDRILPLGRLRRAPAGLRYYNPEVHRAAFALPNLLAEKLR